MYDKVLIEAMEVKATIYHVKRQAYYMLSPSRLRP